MSHQNGLSNNATETTGFTEPDDGDDRIQKENENVAHARMVSNRTSSGIQDARGIRLPQAFGLPPAARKEISWRPGSRETLRSRFAAVRVGPAHRDEKRMVPHPEEWLVIEWPKKESEPTKYWLSTLPPNASWKSLVKIAKHRWIIERDYEELKQELGLGHYEGRNWRGFHHHATLCIAAYGFLISERNRFSPSVRAGHLGLSAPELPPTFRPRGSPH